MLKRASTAARKRTAVAPLSPRWTYLPALLLSLVCAVAMADGAAPTLADARAMESSGDIDATLQRYRALAEAHPPLPESAAAALRLAWLESRARQSAPLLSAWLQLQGRPDPSLTVEALETLATQARAVEAPIQLEVLAFAAQALDERLQRCDRAAPLYREARLLRATFDDEESRAASRTLALAESSCLERTGRPIHALLALRGQELTGRAEVRRLWARILVQGFAPLGGVVLWLLPALTLMLLGHARSSGVRIGWRQVISPAAFVACALWLVAPALMVRQVDPTLVSTFAGLGAALGGVLLASAALGAVLRSMELPPSLRLLARACALLAVPGATLRVVASTELPELLLHWPSVGRPGGEALPVLLLAVLLLGGLLAAALATGPRVGAPR